MARKTQEIKDEITTAFMGNEAIRVAYGYSVGAVFEETFSKASLENILFEIFAISIWTLEKLFDTHKKEIDTLIFEQKNGTLPWYRTMALAFQYGFDLLPDSDKFNNEAATEEQIESSKIIKYAAVLESPQDSRVIIKIAGETNGVLAPITPAQNEAFESYINEVRYAGVKTTIINYLPDRLFLNILIKRDALVLDNKGMSILNANYPVNEAIAEFMKELPFDGELRLSALTDKLQAVEGVLDATILSADSAWVNDYDNPQPIFISKIPTSGYFEIVNFDNIKYVV